MRLGVLSKARFGLLLNWSASSVTPIIGRDGFHESSNFGLLRRTIGKGGQFSDTF